MKKMLLGFAFSIPLLMLATFAHGQSGPGITLQGTPYACPIIVNNQQTGWVPGTTCQNATVTNCASAQDLPFIFGYESPAQGVTYKGTIVILNGGAGTTPNDVDAQPLTFGPYYLQNGYEIVQVAWATPWEDTGGTSGSNIAAAACRPATLLSYVHGNPLLFQGTPQNKAGMCAQGTSAGSAAIGYSLVWYGAGAFLDKVELLSGPVLSDIEQGCEVSANGQGAPNVTVCPTTETSCHRGSALQPWSQTPEYIDGYAFGPRNWTGDNNCAGSQQTSSTEDTAWLNQSINAPVPGGAPPLTNTDITAWLCASVANGGPMNNSSSQGQLFYNFIGSEATFDTFPVTTCPTAEAVTGNGAVVPFLNNEPGLNAIEADMVSGTSSTTSAQCKLNH